MCVTFVTFECVCACVWLSRHLFSAHAFHLMRGERGSVPASRSAWRDFECWSADATRKSRDAKNVLFWQLRTTVSAHEKESYLLRTSKRQRLSDMILPP